MTAQSVINLAPSTKEQVTIFAAQLISDVEAGVTNPLTLHSQIIILEKALSQVKDAIKEMVLTEAEKHGAKSFDYNGCRVDIKELGTKYDYSRTEDAEWNQLFTEEKKYQEKKRERESFLKNIKGHLTIVDEETGEVSKIYPPIKTSTTGITVTLK